MHSHIHAYTHTHMCTKTHMHLHTHMHVHAHVHIHLHKSTHTQTHAHTHKHTHANTQAHTTHLNNSIHPHKVALPGVQYDCCGCCHASARPSAFLPSCLLSASVRPSAFLPICRLSAWFESVASALCLLLLSKLPPLLVTLPLLLAAMWAWP